MPEPYTDQQLDAVLASVGRHLVVPTGGADVALTSRPRAERPTRTLVLVAAAVLLVVLVVGAAIAPVRDAVADWLGIGSTSIEQVPRAEGDPAGLPPLAAEAVPITRAGARAELGGALPTLGDDRLGTPVLRALPREGGVLMVWPEGKTTLWIRRDQEGEGRVLAKKLMNLDEVRYIPGLGDMAVLIEGRHVFETPARRVAAGRVLLWVEDGLEYRLESELRPAAMLAIARSVSAPSR